VPILSEAGEATMYLEDIPHGKERAILADMVLNLFDLSRLGIRQAGITGDACFVALALYWGTLHSKALTAHKIALISEVPRSTTQRHLAFLVRIGFAQREGGRFFISDRVLKNPAVNVKEAIKIVLRAAGELIAVQNGR
jgi:hypothetical protein